jgi:hypothetical protein
MRFAHIRPLWSFGALGETIFLWFKRPLHRLMLDIIVLIAPLIILKTRAEELDRRFDKGESVIEFLDVAKSQKVRTTCHGGSMWICPLA